jgi:hypothetical protein
MRPMAHALAIEVRQVEGRRSKLNRAIIVLCSVMSLVCEGHLDTYGSDKSLALADKGCLEWDEGVEPGDNRDCVCHLPTIDNQPSNVRFTDPGQAQTRLPSRPYRCL